MQRWKLTIEYDGRPFSGWQRQDNGPSVQQALEEAVEQLFGETVPAHASGRTDAGVHAVGQVVHFGLEKPFAAATESSTASSPSAAPTRARAQTSSPCSSRRATRTALR